MSERQLLLSLSGIVCLLAGLLIVPAITSRIDREWELFQVECLDDGIVHGRRHISQPFDPYFLAEAARLAEMAGHAAVQLGPFLWVSRERINPPTSAYARIAEEDPRLSYRQWAREASLLPISYERVALFDRSVDWPSDPDVAENNPALIRRYQLFWEWWATDPPGPWRNETKITGTCFADDLLLRPEWLQRPGSLMSRLIWRDRFRRLAAWLSGGEPA